MELQPYHLVITRDGTTIDALAFSPDATRLVTGYHDGTIGIWNTQNGKEERTSMGHGGAVIRSLVVTSEGRKLVSSDENGRTRVWNITSQTLVKEWTRSSGLSEVAISPDNRLLAIGDRKLNIYPLDGGQGIKHSIKFKGDVTEMRFSPDGDGSYVDVDPLYGNENMSESSSISMALLPGPGSVGFRQRDFLDSASTFVPTSRAPRAIRSQTWTVPIPPPSPVTTSHRTTSVGNESEESKRRREEQARLEQEKDAAERAKKEGEERKRKEEEEEEEAKRKEEEAAKRKEEEDKREQERIRKEEEQKERLRLEEERKRAEEEARLEEQRKKPPKVQKEALRIDSSSMPPPLEIPRQDPGPLDINAAKKDVSTPLPALATARNIERLQDIEYPEGVRSPRGDLNKDAKDGKFRYDRDFLMQFMQICKEKPPHLPPLDILGIFSVGQSTFSSMTCTLGRHRLPSSAMAQTARSSSVGLGIASGFGAKPGAAPSPFAVCSFSTTGKLTSEERYLLAIGARSASASGGPAAIQIGRPPLARTASQGGPGAHPMGSNRVRSKRGDGRTDANKVTQQGPLEELGFGASGAVPVLGAAFEVVAPLEVSANRWVAQSTVRKPGATDTDSPELVDRKVRAHLNKLTMEKFDPISDQIISWANKSENEKEGRTLFRVVRLVFEMATRTDEAAWSEMYARLCRKMMETISPEVQDDGIKNAEGKPIAGGQLFRKYLLNRYQEDFERGWVAKETTAAAAAAKASEDQALKAANEKKGDESELYSDEYYAAQKAKRQGLGLIKFIGELFKLQMLTERIMHECIKKLLGSVENPEEEEIESLCQLLKTVGQLLDVPKARAHMDAYFTRMKELRKSINVSPRMQSMLQDVIELRDRKWVARGAYIYLSCP